jgi:hypothetical protein
MISRSSRSRDVYQLIVEQCGRALTIVMSNRNAAEWLTAFDKTLLAQSTVALFTRNAYDLASRENLTGRGSSPSSMTTSRHGTCLTSRSPRSADAADAVTENSPSLRAPNVYRIFCGSIRSSRVTKLRKAI